jgi:hypothetical protein
MAASLWLSHLDGLNVGEYTLVVVDDCRIDSHAIPCRNEASSNVATTFGYNARQGERDARMHTHGLLYAGVQIWQLERFGIRDWVAQLATGRCKVDF